MKNISNQYTDNSRYVAVVSGKTHPALEKCRPLSVQEMYTRAIKGLPLSVPLPSCDRIPLNGKFFIDGFDVLDAAIANNFRLSAEEKKKQILANEQLKKEREEFEKWKLDQQRQHVSETSV